MNTFPKKLIRSLLAFVLAIGGFAVTGLSAAAAPVTIDLCAVPGSAALTGAVTVPIWGFALNPGDCSTAVASLPGPVLSVNEGDMVTINVTNALPAGHTLTFEVPGIAFDPGPTDAAPGATVTRTFNAGAPGTYLYQSGGDAGRQEAMGLYGALLVRSATSGQAYDAATTAYDVEATLVLSQVDPNFNAAPETFDMNDYLATYWLINGKAYPDTAPILATAGQNVLLRYLNAGYDNTSMMLLGMHERVVARGARLLNNPFDADAETLPAGATEDTIATVLPFATAPSVHGFPLFNRNLHVTNGSPAVDGGGMLTFISQGVAVDQPPTVNAGVDQTITLPASANLDGTVTDDGLSPLTTLWTMTSGPGTVTFGDASLVDTTASFSVDGVYVLRLTATDGTGSISDEVSITVNPVSSNTPPTVTITAPADQSVYTFGDNITFNGTASDTQDGDLTASLVWTSGLDGQIGTGGSFSTSSLSVGTQIITASVTDSGNLQGLSVVIFTINPAQPVDQPPTVNAGLDQTITLPASANLDGTVTDDGLSPLTTQWSQTSGPGTTTFGDASLVDTTASFSAAGSYVLRLTATDGTGSVFDEVAITVNPAPAATMHIGAMSGSVTNNSPGGPGGGTYTVQVVITVHDAGHNPLNGVTVSGTWTTTGGGFTATTSSCVTSGAGQCTVQAVHNLNPNNASNNLTYTVNNLTLASYTYASASNDVPNSVTVARP